jgi:hypothetical protein
MHHRQYPIDVSLKYSLCLIRLIIVLNLLNILSWYKTNNKMLSTLTLPLVSETADCARNVHIKKNTLTFSV